jgi:hypothetical protein
VNGVDLALQSTAFAKPSAPTGADNPALRKAFNAFVGETFYGQMLHAMRQSVGKPAYFDGGRAEEVFTQQLDQMLATRLAHAASDRLSAPMYQLFTLARK